MRRAALGFCMLYSAQPAQTYRAVFLSDLHIGAKSFDAAALLAFLRSMRCDRLYLVGDIIDGWKLKKRWHWTEACSAVLDELVHKNRTGTAIYYLPGNHDDEIRHLNPLAKYQLERKLRITIVDKMMHVTARGQRFLVLHGDQFDRAILRGPLSRWSDRIYDLFLDMIGGHGLEKIHIDGQIKPFSLAKALRLQGQRALQLLNNVEAAVVSMARARHADGLICGHTHIPVIKPIQDIVYANAGSWLRGGHTALAETMDGALTLIDWPASTEQTAGFQALNSYETANKAIMNETAYCRPATERIIQKISAIWHPPRPRFPWLAVRRQPGNMQTPTHRAQEDNASSHKMTDIRLQTV